MDVEASVMKKGLTLETAELRPSDYKKWAGGNEKKDGI
jgi:hypothetical protein